MTNEAAWLLMLTIFIIIPTAVLFICGWLATRGLPDAD